MRNRVVRIGKQVVDRTVLEETIRELRQYQHRRRRYDYLRLRYQQVPLESRRPHDGLPRSSGVGDPTLRAVERMEEITEEMAELAAWLLTVDAALADLPEVHQEILRHQYLQPGVTKEYTMVGLAQLLSVSEREAYLCRNEALLHLALCLRGEEILQEPCRTRTGVGSKTPLS